jgi:hypothetical protein
MQSIIIIVIIIKTLLVYYSVGSLESNLQNSMMPSAAMAYIAEQMSNKNVE